MDARELEAIGRRPWQYWNEDGLTDLLGGVSLLAMGTMLWALQHDRYLVAILAFAPWLLVTGRWGEKLLRRAKERLVFPRTGRIALRRSGPPGRKAPVVMLFLALLTLAALLVLARDAFPGALTLLTGLALSGVLLWAGVQLGIRRYLVMGVLYILFSVWVATVHREGMSGIPILFAGIGAGQILSGTLALLSFLHSAPPAPQE